MVFLYSLAVWLPFAKKANRSKTICFWVYIFPNEHLGAWGGAISPTPSALDGVSTPHFRSRNSSCRVFRNDELLLSFLLWAGSWMAFQPLLIISWWTPWWTVAKFSLKTARFHNSKNGKSPDLLDFFDGSGDVIRTHDTPGMKACVDEVQKMSEPKNIETSGVPVHRLCVSCVHGGEVHHSWWTDDDLQIGLGLLEILKEGS